MEKTSNEIKYFEAELQRKSINKPSALYKGTKKKEKLIETTQDVIDSVNVQIKAMQVADCVKTGKLSKMNYDKSNFLTIDKLSNNFEQETNNKFETQCISDTQLIEIVKTAEVLGCDRAMQQEFDNTFCYKTIDRDKCNSVNVSDNFKNVSHTEIGTRGTVNTYSSEINKNSQPLSNFDVEVQSFSPDVFIEKNKQCIERKFEEYSSQNVYYTKTFNMVNKANSIIIETIKNNNCNISKDLNITGILQEDTEIKDNTTASLSPVLNIRSVRQSKTPSPLIFDLEVFEKFETLVLPEMIKDTDFNTTKHSVYSQIFVEELQTHSKSKEEIELHSQSLNVKSEQIGLEKLSLAFNMPLKIENIKSNDSLQDEILFSSDEEENYNPKQSQDLPFTCALETSFYDQSPILDKTIYVGFQTASNKSIQVCSKTFSKAKSIFEDLDDDCSKKECTITELVNKCDKISVSNGYNILRNVDIDYDGDDLKNPRYKHNNEAVVMNNHITGTSKTNDKSPNNILLESVQKSNLCVPSGEMTNLNRCNMGGFVTASNINIKLSDIALTRCKKVFQGIDLEEHFDSNVEETLLNIDPKEHEKDFELSEINNKLTDIKVKTNKNEILPNIDDENILQEFQYSEMIRDNLLTEVDHCIKESKQKSDSQGFETYCAISTNTNNFKTVCNKMNKSSIATTSKLKTGLDDLQFIDYEKLQSFSKEDVYKESITVFDDATSNEILRKTKHLCKDIDESIEKDNENIKFQGFKAANEKEIKISYEALDKSKKLFEDIAFSFKDHSSTNFRNENSEQNFSIIVNKITDTQSHDQNICRFVGFKTANNKSITISKQALEKSAKIFQDLDQNEVLHKTVSKEDTNENQNTKTPSFTGFQTASNKTVKISAQALAKTKKIFQDLDLNDYSKPEHNFLLLNEEVPTLSNFQTASNKEVTLSAEALAKSKKRIESMQKLNLINVDTLKIDTNKQNLENLIEIADKPESINTNQSFPSTFKGFQTASNKEVKISEQALAKCRQIFQDEDLSSQVSSNQYFQAIEENRISTVNANKHKTVNKIFKIETNCINNLGFKTASNRKIVISEDALLKSKILLDELDNKAVKTSPKDVHLDTNRFEEKEILQNIVNTQILNNFNETLYTEDFHEDIATSKRSGSPILSCPRAKKKKFETPYKICQTPIKMSKVEDIKVKNKSMFKDGYKTCKLYKLRDIKILESKHSIKNVNIHNITFDNLLNFVFSGNRNELTNNPLQIEDLKEMFKSAVNKKLIPDGWLDNHLRLILWKLLSYESAFPNTLGVVCTLNNVLNQLKYRYNKELYNAERPALRKILEKDDVPTKTLILCVVDIIKCGLNKTSVTSLENKVEIVVTDGWYCLKACLDKMLTEFVLKNKILVGTKIITNGAELLNCEQGISPWEDTSSVRLKLFGNSTRRARWDSRLGYHNNTYIVSRLSQVRADGGKVSKLRVFVARVYPPLYIEKFEDGNTVTRSERLEHIHEVKYEAERQALLERLYEEVEKEFSDGDSQDSEDIIKAKKRKILGSDSEVPKMATGNLDTFDFGNHLTESQAKSLEDHASKRRERLLRDVQARLLEKMEKHGLCRKRNVVALLKARVVELEEKGDGVLVTKGIISVWKPNESVLELIKEGLWINVMNVVPTSFRGSELHISAGRQSIFSKPKIKENDKIKPHIQPLLRNCYHIKELIRRSFPKDGYNEIDTVGIIISIEPSIECFNSNENQFQNVFLADYNKNIICVNFWGGLKKFGFEKVLDTGQVFACVNLQERVGNTRKNIPQYRVTEFTYFTRAPKNAKAREMVEDLANRLLLDRRKFCQDCVNLKNNVTRLQNNENITPYRVNSVIVPKSRMFIDTPMGLKPNVIDEFDVSGLDFESTFKQKDTQEISPKVLLRKKQVREKIDRLRMYGEPPPLSHIHIVNKSAIKCYKSPLNSVENSVASLNKPENFPNSGSPVTSTNRTCVKSAFNPVKINFDKLDNNNSVDHFAEEFDGSPPLSLE